jgi:hypothetical protein
MGTRKGIYWQRAFAEHSRTAKKWLPNSARAIETRLPLCDLYAHWEPSSRVVVRTARATVRHRTKEAAYRGWNTRCVERGPRGEQTNVFHYRRSALSKSDGPCRWEQSGGQSAADDDDIALTASWSHSSYKWMQGGRTARPGGLPSHEFSYLSYSGEWRRAWRTPRGYHRCGGPAKCDIEFTWSEVSAPQLWWSLDSMHRKRWIGQLREL